MAKTRTGEKAGGKTEHKSRWQQPWFKSVMQGDYTAFEKLVFDRVSSFGVNGCYAKDRTLAKDLGCSMRYVKAAIAKLWKGGELWITGWDSRNRYIYAMKNPEVVAKCKERYQEERKAGTVKDKAEFWAYTKTRIVPTVNYSSPLGEQECTVGGTIVHRNGEQECTVHLRETRERIKELELRRADSSSPADEQPNPPARAVESWHNLAIIKEKIFSKNKQPGPPLTDTERQDRAQKQRAALMASDKLDKKGVKQ